MGANAQTTVQKFLSGAVLTAEQQNTSAATGVPVFATTVTRDAAFGGANKVLAEGQTCYLESTNVVQYYDGAAWATVGPAAAGALTLITPQTAFTATTGVTVSDVFTSTYTNYLLTVVTTVNGADDVLMQFTAGGTATATNYNYQVFGATSTTVAASRTTGATSAFVLRSSNGTYTQVTNITIFSPQVSGITMFQAIGLNQQSAATPYTYTVMGNQSATTQFDGFKLLSANNITGHYTLYGYSK